MDTDYRIVKYLAMIMTEPVTRKKAAEIFGCHPDTIKNYISAIRGAGFNVKVSENYEYYTEGMIQADVSSLIETESEKASQQMAKAIRLMLHTSWTDKTLTQELGCDESKLAHLISQIKKAGFKLVKSHNRYKVNMRKMRDLQSSQETIERVAEMYMDGLALSQISRKTGMSINSIYRVIDRQKLPARGRGRYKMFSAPDVQKMKLLRSRGMSYACIAKKMGCSTMTARNYIKTES